MAVTSLVALVSCSGAEPDSSSWESWIEQARDHASTDFELEVLADGKVTDAEFGEAFTRFADCMATKGFEVEQTDYKGAYSGFSIPANGKDLDAAVADEAVRACEQGTTLFIEQLYLSMKSNPSGDESSSREFDCLRERGIVPEEFTIDDYYLHSEQGTLPYDTDSEAVLDCHYGV